jgi:hypothetical protein
MITPHEYNNLKCADIEDEIEHHIDRALRNAEGRNMITIAAKGWDRQLVANVLAKYRAAGWVTDVVGDWRDGDYISMVLP